MRSLLSWPHRAPVRGGCRCLALRTALYRLPLILIVVPVFGCASGGDEPATRQITTSETQAATRSPTAEPSQVPLPTPAPSPTVGAAPSPMPVVLPRVLLVQFGTRVGPDGLMEDAATTFPQGTMQVGAVVRLEGVSPGMKVTGTWYQLGVVGAPPEGMEASSSTTILGPESISTENRTRVMFRLTIGGPGFSQLSAWQLRLFVDGQLVATSGFSIVAR